MTRAPILAPADRNRLVSVLGLLGSDQPGERDAAALAAVRLLRKAGLGWDQVVLPAPANDTPPRSSAPHAAPPRPDWQDDLALCRRYAPRLSGWEQDFILSLHGRRKGLSSGQVAKLAEIVAELRKAGCA